jgi:alpha-beta hydrolase superfamily lysophospholipase
VPLSSVPSITSTEIARNGTPQRVLRWQARRPFMGLLLLHTFGSHAERYERVAGHIALGGLTVEAFDLPGHGAAAGAGTLTWDALLDAVDDRLAALRADLPGLPVGIYGHGLGGLLAVDNLLGDRPHPDAAILISPSLVFVRPIPSWRLALKGRFGGGTVRLVPDPATLAVDAALVEGWRRDPLVRWDYPATFVEAVQDAQARVAARLPSLPAPYLILHGGQDPISPPKGWFALPRGMDRERPTSILPAMRHDLPVDQGWRERVGWHTAFLRGVGERHFPDTTPPDHRDWGRFERISRAQAVAEFEAYVAGEGERLRRFHEIVARLGGPPLDSDAESMDRFGAWLLDALEWGEPPADPPFWAPPSGTGHALSADSIALIDGLATFIAACYRALAPQLEWRLCTTKIDAYYQRPLLEPLHLAPPIPAIKVLSVARQDEPDRHWLGSIWAAWERNLDVIRARGFVDEPADPLPLDEVAVDPYDHDRFNAQIWIPEGAEVALGEARFAELATRLARLKGIEDLVHEDREVFLIRVAHGQDLDALRSRVVGVVRRMKAAAARTTSVEEPE